MFDILDTVQHDDFNATQEETLLDPVISDDIQETTSTKEVVLTIYTPDNNVQPPPDVELIIQPLNISNNTKAVKETFKSFWDKKLVYLKDIEAQITAVGILDINDKTSYELISTLRKQLKNERLKLGKDIIDGKKAPQEFVKALNEIDNTIETAYKAIELIASTKENAYEQLVAAEKQRVAKEEAELLQKRVDALKAIDSEMDLVLLKAMSPEQFDKVLIERTQIYTDAQELKARLQQIVNDRFDALMKVEKFLPKETIALLTDQEYEDILLLATAEYNTRKETLAQALALQKSNQELLAKVAAQEKLLKAQEPPVVTSAPVAPRGNGGSTLITPNKQTEKLKDIQLMESISLDLLAINTKGSDLSNKVLKESIEKNVTNLYDWLLKLIANAKQTN